MSYFLFIIYLLFTGYYIARSTTIRHSRIHYRWWLVFYITKIGAACLYGYWYSKKPIDAADTWWFQQVANSETALLKDQPATFFSNIFTVDYTGNSGVFQSYGFWNDLKSNLLIKMLAIMNLISNSNYYVNALLYSFITFWGFVWLYRCIAALSFKQPAFISFLLLCFLPSNLFWTSGIHRDGIMLLCIGAFLWQLSKPVVSTKQMAYTLLKSLMILLLLFLMRNYISLLLMPLLAVWALSQYIKIPAKWLFAGMYLAGLTWLFFSPGMLQLIIDRKEEFSRLTGNSKMLPISLTPSLGSFIRALPQAIDHAIFQPYIWQNGIMEKMAAAEMLAILAFIIFTAFYTKPTTLAPRNACIYWGIALFCTSVLLLIGYTVPFAGAVVRYRCVLIMLIPLLVSMRYQHK